MSESIITAKRRCLDMTKAEILDLYYRTLDWKEMYYEAQAKMDTKKDSGRQA